MDSFSLLFSPINIGSMEVRNRIVMAPMTSGYSSADGHVTQTLMDFYLARANGGVGLITCESCYVEERGKGFVGHLSLDHDKYIPGLTELTASVKSAGAKIFLQLIHCGRQTTPALCGQQPVAPSPIPCPVLKEMPHEASITEIEHIIEAFVKAAHRARKAGFDGVEVHAAHGYLINQFLSPYSNKRTDAYGGNLFSRSKMLLEIVSRIKQEVGSDFPVSCRLSADEFVQGGLTPVETRIVARWLQNIGLDAISVSGGVYESAHKIIPPMDVEPGSLVYLAAGIKQVVTIPVFAVASINDPFFADQILIKGEADMVALGRALLADPHWPVKAQKGDSHRIRPCLYCNHCRNRALRPKINCAVNYGTGRETGLLSEPKGTRPKKVIVVGGGISGLEAARISAKKGHHVSLYERTADLGGNLLLAGVPPRRARMLKIIDFFKNEIEVLGVKVFLNAQASPQMIQKRKPDVVLLATGAKPMLPDIPGIDGPNVYLATKVLRGEADIGKCVVVVGGGLVGLETADYLRGQGKAVIIVEKLPEVGTDPKVEAIFQKSLMGRLTKTDESILIITSTEVKNIGPDHVTIKNASGEKILPDIDSVVIATGFKAYTPIKKDDLGPDCEVHVIGDAIKPQTLFEAIHSAAEIAYKL
jgi:2,4-dienoyl-CoA reductase-like NADH-dependent reductase (Old Yellow Enzyme family)